jgi:hypothetical protein
MVISTDILNSENLYVIKESQTVGDGWQKLEYAKHADD